MHRYLRRAHIKSLASYPIPTPSAQNSRTSTTGKHVAEPWCIVCAFFPSRAHSEPCMDGTGLGGVDGRLPRFALSSSELCERRAATMLWLCSGPRVSTPCLVRTHSNSKLWRHFSALCGLFLTCIRSADLRLPAMRAWASVVHSQKSGTALTILMAPVCSSQDSRDELSFASNPCVTRVCLQRMRTV
jgi:hypothetical protein